MIFTSFISFILVLYQYPAAAEPLQLHHFDLIHKSNAGHFHQTQLNTSDFLVCKSVELITPIHEGVFFASGAGMASSDRTCESADT
ncbi:hypothetical protein HDU67_008233, partial [Dinochytrium kinnereticum]